MTDEPSRDVADIAEVINYGPRRPAMTEEPFCPEHGGPADDCEQCRDERETADDRATDDFYARAPERQWCEDDKADSYEEEP